MVLRWCPTDWLLVIFTLACGSVIAEGQPRDVSTEAPVREMTVAHRPGVIGHQVSKGWILGAAITSDALWAVAATPSKRPEIYAPTYWLVRIDLASNRMTTHLDLGTFPWLGLEMGGGSLAADRDSVWVAEGLGGEAIHRINTQTARVEASVAIPLPASIVVGGGHVWVSGMGDWKRLGGLKLRVSEHAVYKIDRQTGSIVGKISFPVGERPTSALSRAPLLAKLNRALWAVDVWAGTVHRIDPDSDRVVASIPVPEVREKGEYGYSLASSDSMLYLIRRQFPDGLSKAVGRTVAWPIDTSANVIGPDRQIELANSGDILLLNENGCWIGNLHKDEIFTCDPASLKPKGSPRIVGHPVYALVSDEKTLWAIGGGGLTTGDTRLLSWITRTNLGVPHPD